MSIFDPVGLGTMPPRLVPAGLIGESVPAGFVRTGVVGLRTMGPAGLLKTGVAGLLKTGVAGLLKTGVAGLLKTGVAGLLKTGLAGLLKAGLAGLAMPPLIRGAALEGPATATPNAAIAIASTEVEVRVVMTGSCPFRASWATIAF